MALMPPHFDVNLILGVTLGGVAASKISGDRLEPQLD
jgi:hypothetical protein